MIVGTVTDAAGVKHRVSYSSQAQNDQIIVLVDPGRLSVRTPKTTVRAEPGKTILIDVEVARGNGLRGPVTITCDVPDHFRGVRVTSATIPPGSNRGSLRLTFGKTVSREFNMPLAIRATLQEASSKRSYHAQSSLTVVAK